MFSKRKDDHSRFNAIIDRYQERIYNHIRRMVVSHEDANDVTQETFIRIFRNLDSLKDDSSMTAWIYRIATNESIRFLNSRHNNVAIGDEVDEQTVPSLSDSEYVDYDNAMAVHFQNAILSLPQTQRTVFNLRYYDDLSYEEIATILGKTAGTVKVSYHLAKERIKKYITINCF